MRFSEFLRPQFNSVAASAAVTNTVAETAFDKKWTQPQNTLRAGDILKVRLLVRATATNSTDTLNVKLKIGTTVVAQTGAVDVANDDVAYIDMDIVIRTIGAAGTLVAAGVTSIGTAGTATTRPAHLASTAVDTTVAQDITASATWSVANAGNSCRLEILSVERRVAA
jgi:hypothetical protein